jgi:hypothetical protein
MNRHTVAILVEKRESLLKLSNLLLWHKNTKIKFQTNELEQDGWHLKDKIAAMNDYG